MKPMLISGLQMLVNGEWLNGHVLEIHAGKIHALASGASNDSHLKFPQEYFLVPGFIDLHIHGANNFDVMDGTTQALEEIQTALAQEGVTGFLATTMTASNERIAAVLTAVAEMPNTSSVLGVHLEGPFISPEKCGAQLSAIKLPDYNIVKDWQVLANNSIKLMTIAPELEHSAKLIQLLNSLNIIASVGHTNATYAETQQSIYAGCRYATHLFNAMRGIHQREPGAAGALLLSEKVIAELIVDDHHLHPAIIELAFKIKGCKNLLLVTDSIRAKCMPDGKYELGGQEIFVVNGKATLQDGTLAGSTLTLPQALKKFIQHTQCSLKDALMLVTENPVRVLGLQNKKGSIAVGKDADLVVLDAELNVVMTIRNGEIIYQSHFAFNPKAYAETPE